MRIAPIKHLKQGAVLARNIYASNGRILLGRGVALNDNYMKKLGELQIPSVYINDSNFDDVEFEEPISERTRLEAGEVLVGMGEAAGYTGNAEPGKWNSLMLDGFKKRVDSRKLQNTASSMVEELLGYRNVLLQADHMRAKSDHLVTHSINTTILATICGLRLQLNSAQLQDLAVGCLLHDVGLMFLKPDLSEKSLPEMSPEERKLYCQHPQIGFEVLRRMEDVSILSAHVAFQHHETANGGGFPRRLHSQDMHLYAQIAAVADMFDHLTMGDLGKKLLPHQAHEILMTQAGTRFDYSIVDAFVRSVAVYPNGCSVELSNHEKGVVVRQSDLPSRPVVRTVHEKDGVITAKEYDMSKELTLFITEVIEDILL